MRDTDRFSTRLFPLAGRKLHRTMSGMSGFIPNEIIDRTSAALATRIRRFWNASTLS
jgi:hypothetical protein